MNIEHLIFTCPKCGSHEYLRVDHCLACYKEHSLRRIDGNPMPGETEPELTELEPRGLAGLRCAKCMYPDTCRTRFRWKSWQDAEAAACLSPDPDKGRSKVSCLVCALDGRAYRTYAMLLPGEMLKPEERRRILRHVLGEHPGTVFCERDRVEELPSAPDEA